MQKFQHIVRTTQNVNTATGSEQMLLEDGSTDRAVTNLQLIKTERKKERKKNN